MNLSPVSIAIIIVVFGASFLLMIPFIKWNNKIKNKAADFISQNSHQAILHLYGDSPIIDGTPINKLAKIRGSDLEHIVALTPGKHTIEAKYSSSEPNITSNVNYKSEKITSDILLEAGHEYTLSMYFYSPEQRASYYDGDVGEVVFSQELTIESRTIGAHNKAYIICYLEK